MTAPNLKSYQALMEHSLLTAMLDDDCHELMALFATKGEVTTSKDEAELRLAIYRNNVMHSLTTALGDLYPVIKKLIGDDCFKAAATEFVRLHPPKHAALLHYGEEFSEFISTFPPCVDLPFLADVARLEFVQNQAYHQADSEVFDPQILGQVPAEQLANVSFSVVDSLYLLDSVWPIDEIWQQNQQQEQQTIDLDNAVAANLIVYREDLAVQMVNLDRNCYVLLSQLISGKAIGVAWQETVNSAQEAGRDIDDSELGGMLGYLFSLNVFSGFQLGTEE
ncbi:DNA-binding domain-containing protein [Psychrobium sp. MM17-31]|uniref:HvfC/BufC N-terminal domain-containing protein n=1 Tax=Psychrobium sp. MM17-31 TaxID=2917758 RepID=UPI001EF6D4B7|nr:DNA-binding domain-containing protein [Psychrobium sp. MM17-31]MCG7530971.1 DNA-binding domain-containing protein [Psychrobium sp. MM17-31]